MLENSGGLTAKEGLNGRFISSVYLSEISQKITGPTAPPIFWTIFEVSVAVIAACLPPLAPLLKKAPTPRRLANSIRQVLSSHSSKESIRLSETPPKSQGYRLPISHEGEPSGDSSTPSENQPVEAQRTKGIRWDHDMV
jgi:hypothetical protein